MIGPVDMFLQLYAKVEPLTRQCISYEWCRVYIGAERLQCKGSRINAMRNMESDNGWVVCGE